MGIHHDYKSKRGERAMAKQQKREAKFADNAEKKEEEKLVKELKKAGLNPEEIKQFLEGKASSGKPPMDSEDNKERPIQRPTNEQPIQRRVQKPPVNPGLQQADMDFLKANLLEFIHFYKLFYY